MVIPGLKIDAASSEPVYRQIADGVRAAAQDGRLRPGHRLPPTRDLARQLDVNRNTVVAAYDALADDGWVRSHTGKGTFLVARDAAGKVSGPDEGTWFTTFSRTAEGAALGGLQSIYGLILDGAGISFVGSYPSDELMPVEAFSQSLGRALRDGGSSLMAYGPTAGHPLFRETLAAEMAAAGSPVEAEDILVTNGAQQALELTFRTFLDRGDPVVIEDPTYTGALNVLGALDARVIPVPVDGQGIRPDLLEIALERHRPRLLYVQPTFQNPTAAVMGEARRREILAIANRHRCPIVEDDWAGDLRFEGDREPTLHALDEGRHVIYLSTFSKKLMPGLRVGWVAAPRPVLERLVELKRIQDCGTSPLLQLGLHAFIRDGGLRDHLQRVRPAYRARRDSMLRALEKHFPEDASWSRPEGGLFLWIDVPGTFDGNDLFAAARSEGVLYSRGELFYAGPPEGNKLRLAYSAASRSEIDAGVARLGELIRSRRDRAEKPPCSRAESVPFF